MNGGYSAPPAPWPMQTAGWGGMGPTPTQQTYTPAGTPSWAQQGAQAQQPGAVPGQPNWFGMPWWGMSAAGGPIQQPQPQQAPAPQGPQGIDPATLEALKRALGWGNQLGRRYESWRKIQNLHNQPNNGYGDFLTNGGPRMIGNMSALNSVLRGSGHFR